MLKRLPFPLNTLSFKAEGSPYLFTITILFLLSLGFTSKTAAAEEPSQPLAVVASFSILGDMVQSIGGERIELTTLIGPNEDNHFYQPTPKANKILTQTELMFVNGLEFEAWLERLLESSEYKGKVIVATKGITPLKLGAHDEEHHGDGHKEHGKNEKHHDDEHHDGHAHKDNDKHGKDDDHAHHHHGEEDPHAWQSLELAKTYIQNITTALQEADPAGKDFYAQRQRAYLEKLEALEASAQKRFAELPEDQRTVVTSHDAFAYFGQAYDIKFLSLQGLNTANEATAKQVAEIIEQIRENNIRAIFQENQTNPKLIQQVTEETGVAIGGTLYPGSLSAAGEGAETYLEMMEHNINTVYQALKP